MARWGLLIGAFLALALAPAVARAQTDDEPDPKWNSERCLSCHDGSTTAATFPSGEELIVDVDGPAFLSSHHAEVGVECVHCHKDITGFPHDPLTIPDVATFRERLSTSCSECHWRQYRIAIDGAHALIPLEDRSTAPTCIDCHDAHAVTAVALDTAEMGAVCADCHDEDVREGLVAIHTFDPTVTEQASRPPLFLFYLLVFGVLVAFVALVWGVVAVIQWSRRSRPAAQG